MAEDKTKTAPAATPSQTGTANLVDPTAGSEAPSGGSTGNINAGAQTGGAQPDFWDQGEVTEAQYEGEHVAIVGKTGDTLGLGKLLPVGDTKTAPSYQAIVSSVAQMAPAQQQELANVLVQAGIVAQKSTPFTVTEIQDALADAVKQTEQAQTSTESGPPTLTGYLESRIQASGTSGTATTSDNVAGYAENLSSIADGYMIPFSQQGMQSLAQQYYNQGLTLDEAKAAYTQQAQQTASGLYPQWAQQISSGIDTKTLLDPYSSLAEKTLGISPDSINWQSPLFQSALMVPNEKGGQANVATLSQFSNTLMTNPAFGYQYTDEANNSAGSLAKSLLQFMGKIPNAELSTSMSGPTPDLAAT